jgi:hypothetical protein
MQGVYGRSMEGLGAVYDPITWGGFADTKVGGGTLGRFAVGASLCTPPRSTYPKRMYHMHVSARLDDDRLVGGVPSLGGVSGIFNFIPPTAEQTPPAYLRSRQVNTI